MKRVKQSEGKEWRWRGAWFKLGGLGRLHLGVCLGGDSVEQPCDSQSDALFGMCGGPQMGEPEISELGKTQSIQGPEGHDLGTGFNSR